MPRHSSLGLVAVHVLCTLSCFLDPGVVAFPTNLTIDDSFVVDSVTPSFSLSPSNVWTVDCMRNCPVLGVDLTKVSLGTWTQATRAGEDVTASIAFDGVFQLSLHVQQRLTELFR